MNHNQSMLAGGLIKCYLGLTVLCFYICTSPTMPPRFEKRGIHNCYMICFFLYVQYNCYLFRTQIHTDSH